jgi:hypothetical protein
MSKCEKHLCMRPSSRLLFDSMFSGRLQAPVHRADRSFVDRLSTARHAETKGLSMISDLKPVRGNRRELHDGRGRGIVAHVHRRRGAHELDQNRPATDALTKRIRHFRKAFAVGLGHRPSTLQAAAIDRCARLAALSEQALADPNTTNNDRVRLDGAYRRARIDMDALLQIKPKLVSRDSVPSLAELLDR